jgi:membrane-bound metal-dependent hydrolase YbcI (DUF457 family)
VRKNCGITGCRTTQGLLPLNLVPSPIGHAVAGLTIAWTAERLSGTTSGLERGAALSASVRRTIVGLPLACAVLAFVPDLDILLGSHRGASHSIGAALAVALVAAAIARARGWPVLTTAIASGCAVGSHAALDWLGRDTSIPLGIQALWPFTSRYFYSGVDLFWDVSRRYWLPREFILGNLAALGHELVILLPFAAAAFYIRFRQAPEIGR